MPGKTASTRIRRALSAFILFSLLLAPVRGQASVSVTQAEGKDFATQVLKDPWDMNEYSDVSQYINMSGQAVNLGNISVADGVFSARTVANDNWFFPLFPGYETAMHIGKIGELYPVKSAEYDCLYIAARIDFPAFQGNELDFLRVLSFADERLNQDGTSKMSLAQAVLTDFDRGKWRLFKIDLRRNVGYASWASRPEWKGIRISPTKSSNVNFAVDWVRLAKCRASSPEVGFTVSGLPQDIGYHFLLAPAATSREILIETIKPSNGAATLDLQGVAAGTYTYRVRRTSDGAQVQSGTVTIDAAPRVTFTRPSTTSGSDYASRAGNPWDFNDDSDIASTEDLLNQVFRNGIFSFSVPSNIPGTTTVDAIINLNTPQAIPTARAYRYLTVRMFTEGPWQNVPSGMMARWIWHMPVGSGQFSCWMVSHDIPYDVGWTTLTLDLYHSFIGGVEETAGECGGLPRTWKDSANLTLLRFDPSENEMGSISNQAIDYIKLTAVDEVKKGSLFPVTYEASEPKPGLKMRFYYTSDLSQPAQNLAEMVSPNVPAGLPNGLHVFMPLVMNRLSGAQVIPDLYWKTTRVPAGEWFLCAVTDDGLNTTTFCSDAPVKVVP